MATWTPQSKTPLTWVAPPPTEGEGEAYELLIGDGFKLDIGNGFYLTIQPAETETSWTPTSKAQGTHTWPQTIVEQTDTFLDIGSGFNLLIDDTHKLIIDPARSDTPWTTITRNPLS